MIVFRNEVKLVTMLLDSSFRQVATSMLRRISVLTSSGSQFIQVERKLVVITGSLCVQYSFTVEISNWNDCDFP